MNKSKRCNRTDTLCMIPVDKRCFKLALRWLHGGYMNSKRKKPVEMTGFFNE